MDRLPSTAIDTLVHRATSVLDPTLRVALVRDALAGLSLEAREEVLQVLEIRGDQGAHEARATLLAAVVAFPPAVTDLPDDPIPTNERTVSPGGQRVERDRVLTLGERKNLARRPQRPWLERALRDAHPDVTTELLRNPRLTEADVVRLCAAPQVPASVLARVFAHPVWMLRMRVRSALVQNPRTPRAMALALLPVVDRETLRAVRDDARLDDTVRARAATRCTPRASMPP